MGKGFAGGILRALGSKEHLATVTRSARVGRAMVRVWFTSQTLLNSEGEAPGNWVRAWFPDPDGSNKLFQRGYTILEADPASGTFAIDFVIHEPTGPAAHFALECEPGDQLAVMRYGEHPFELLDPAPAGYLFLADLAGYPAVTSIAPTVPAPTPVVLLVEASAADREGLVLPEGPNITTAWVDPLPDGQGLVQAIGDRDWTDWYAWVTAESTSTRHARTLLQRTFGLGRATLHSHAYWVRGRQMGSQSEVH